jgi:predicted nucleic acid-binding protein
VILADTSVWIDHFRAANRELGEQLREANVAMHPFLVAELALGSLRERRATLRYLERLPQVTVAQLGEVRRMIEAHSLYSRGIGLTDAHLLASALITPETMIWTMDRRLETVAVDLKIGWRG